MKHSLLFFLCLWRMIDLYSQCSLTSELNKFRVNDTIVKQQIEYKAPGRSGKDVLWDFGKLSPINKKYTLIYSARKGVDSMIVGREHHTRYYYDWQKDSVWLWGFENSTTQIENSKPELLLQLPMHYGDKVQGYYQGEGKSCRTVTHLYGGTKYDRSRCIWNDYLTRKRYSKARVTDKNDQINQ